MNHFLTDDKVVYCYVRCRNAISSMKREHYEQLTKVLQKHYHSLHKAGLYDVMKTYMEQDTLAGMRAMNTFIERRGRDAMVALLKDVVIIYKKNKQNIIQVMRCFSENCHSDALDFIMEGLRLSMNLVKIYGDAEVLKHMSYLYTEVRRNIGFAIGLLKKRHEKRVTVPALEKMKKKKMAKVRFADAKKK